MEFGILGPVEVRRAGVPVPAVGARLRQLLALLVVRANETVAPGEIAMALWGEDAPHDAVRTVRVYVSRLRQALGDPDVLVTMPTGYRLCIAPGDLDAERFERLVEEGRRVLAAGDSAAAAAILREALGLWRGPPLADVSVSAFAVPHIERLEEQRLAAVETRVDADLAEGRHAELVGELRQLTGDHPWRERLYAQLMLALYRGGRQAEALDTYRRAREHLVTELGIEPGAELREIHEGILLQAPSLAAPGQAAQMSPLPAASGPLFGRERDLDALAGVLAHRSARLVTLVGPGGVGKTRLAIEAARRSEEAFRHGTAWVELAPLAEARDVPSAVMHALAAEVQPHEPLESAVLRVLGGKHLLLVLDNLEHLMASAGFLGRLVARCGDVVVLVTSREPTGLAAERRYRVQPLEVPDSHAPARELERSSAAAMFVDRARARDPAFALRDDSAPAVAEICRRVAGLPLALELAAGRIELLAPAELADRLSRSLDVLVGGATDAPPRQRTLRATIDWSFRLLDDAERQAFLRMALFRGGATVHAAEEVTGASLNVLQALLAKHLLVRRESRLGMFEPLREFALERLEEDPERTQVGERLVAWCVGFAREATPHLVRADRRAWLARLDAETPNAVAALSWCVTSGRAARAIELASAWAGYWWATSRYADGLPWLDAALDMAADAPARVRAYALLQRAKLLSMRSERYEEELTAALRLFRECDDPAGIAKCLAHLVPLASGLGETERARMLGNEALEQAQRAGDEATLGYVAAFTIASGAGYEEVAARAMKARRHLRRAGDVYHLGVVCSFTGYTALAEGRFRDALAWLEEALQVADVQGSARSLFYIAGNLGLALLFIGELDDAAQRFGEALAVCVEAGAQDLVDEALLGMAAVATARGDLHRAASLAGAATALGAPSRTQDEAAVARKVHEEFLTPARACMGSLEWDRLAQAGASLAVEQAIELARRGVVTQVLQR